MQEYVTVARIGEIAEGESAAFPVGEKIVALYHSAGKYHAIDDLCPHMGASLSAGQLEGKTVTCPWHAWRFSICDGTWLDNPRLKVDTFEVRIEGDEIQVRVVPNSQDGE